MNWPSYRFVGTYGNQASCSHCDPARQVLIAAFSPAFQPSHKKNTFPCLWKVHLVPCTQSRSLEFPAPLVSRKKPFFAIRSKPCSFKVGSKTAHVEFYQPQGVGLQFSTKLLWTEKHLSVTLGFKPKVFAWKWYGTDSIPSTTASDLKQSWDLPGLERAAAQMAASCEPDFGWDQDRFSTPIEIPHKRLLCIHVLWVEQEPLDFFPPLESVQRLAFP